MELGFETSPIEFIYENLYFDICDDLLSFRDRNGLFGPLLSLQLIRSIHLFSSTSAYINRYFLKF